jgi:predicted phage-related endonuclease
VVRYNEDAEADLVLMREAAVEFVRRLKDGDPPPLDSHSATLGALKKLHPSLGDGDVQVPHSVAFHYREARRLLKEAEERVALHEAVIREYLEDDHARAVYNGHLVASRSVFDQQRIDSKRLRKERPDIAARIHDLDHR